jgi:Protein of unknown function (DUF3014)
MKPVTVWTLSLLLLGVSIGGVYWWQLEQRRGPPNAARAPAASAPAAAAAASAVQYPLEPAAPANASAGTAASGAKPAATLTETLAQALGERIVLQWLNTDAFAHRVAVTVDNLARPHAPARFWPVHPTPGRFTTEPLGETHTIAAANAQRYSAFVAWVETLDAKQLAALYRRLYPQLQRAYEDLGYPGRSFNDRVVSVIDHLIATPAHSGPLEVKLAHIKGPIQPVRPWVVVEFANPELEGLSAGQKLMLRIGADHARRIKAKLGELRAAITPPR